MTSSLRVLIGEDEPDEAQAFEIVLNKMGHRVVGIAPDGRDAVVKADLLTPHLIFMDIHMPRLDGIEASRQIMAVRPTPIILVTGHADQELIERATEAGVMAYLMKPVDAKDLSSAIALASCRFSDLVALRTQVQSLKATLEIRRQVDLAKAILMQQRGLTEAEAAKCLQDLARKGRRTLGEAASGVIAEDRSAEAGG